MREIKIGNLLTCAETGKQFVAAPDGCSVNYARRNGGDEIVSDEGVHLCEVRALKDRSQPFFGYISSDGKKLTGWKGNELGAVIHSHRIKMMRLSYTRDALFSYRIRDVHGAEWYGRGSPGLYIKLRAARN